ncbi:MAG TPA: PAS domain-containing protein, partial [Thermoanaerobaculia bacterium]
RLGSWERDLATNQAVWSDEVYRIFGLEPGTPVNLDIVLEHVHPEDRDRVMNAVERAIKERDYGKCEFRLVVGDETRSVRLIAHAEYDESGRAVKLIGTTQDITEWRAAEEAARQMSSKYQSLVENIPDVAWTANERAETTFISPGVVRITGFTPEETCAATTAIWPGRIHPEDQPEVRAAFQALFESRDLFDAEFRFQCKNGEWVWLHARALAVYEKDGVRLADGVFSDVTEKKLLQSQLEQANRLSSLGRVAATIAHEFNNVMMGIQPFAELLSRKTPTPETIAKATKHIGSAIARGKRITGEILRFTRATPPTMNPIPFKAWLDDVIAEAKPMLGDEIELTVQSDVEGEMLGEATQLQQIVVNLVVNAKQAMPDGGRVTIAARRPDPEATFSFAIVPRPERFVQLTVTDTGVGIPPDVLSRVFEPLFTTKPNGTGLGLAVAHQVARLHEGYIFVESRVGVGTRFHLFLPLANGEIPAVAKEKPAGSLRNLQVLIVEDDVNVARGIATFLEMNGMDVEIAPDGTSALAAIEQSMPDVVVLDLGLPDADGLEIYVALSERRHALPVVFSTGHGDETRLDGFLDERHVAFLTKPYEGDQLLRALDRVTRLSDIS